MPAVLVVDDDADLRESVADVLRGLGWTVTLAEDGERAIELLQRGAPDVILLDVLMPRWNARDFVAALRHGTDEAKQIPIVVFSASLRSRDLAEQLGTPWFIGKPFDVETLIALLERAMRG